ncbi:MAG: hypothetical protein SF053_06395 [Bacteroidia bacterium]|jgi:hypothetical protein|nr:hypothetical protein [Bacteroidia bacterium]
MKVYLILIGVMAGGLGLPVVAQPDNEQVVQSLLTQYLDTMRTGPASISGALPATWLPLTVSGSQIRLGVGVPAVRYQAAGAGWIRTVVVPLTREGDGLSATNLSYTDTLPPAGLRAVRRASPPPLRGDNPLPRARIGMPAAVICTSIIGVISLFYIRSR